MTSKVFIGTCNDCPSNWGLTEFSGVACGNNPNPKVTPNYICESYPGSPRKSKKS